MFSAPEPHTHLDSVSLDHPLFTDDFWDLDTLPLANADLPGLLEPAHCAEIEPEQNPESFT